MRIDRVFTRQDGDAYDGLVFRTASVDLHGPDGTVDLACADLEVPSAWSRAAVEVLAQSVLARGVVPVATVPIADPDVPAWLTPRAADTAVLETLDPTERYGDETSAKQVFDRVAGAWTWQGWRGGLFDGEADARAFFDEIRHIMASQRFLPASPQLRRTGLTWAYGTPRREAGWIVPLDGTRPVRGDVTQEQPALFSAFLQSVTDDLADAGGIMDLLQREARIFRMGAASACNLSGLRGAGEPVGSGGRSAGVVRFLDVGDTAAGPTRRAGVTRRPARLVSLNADHPDLIDFIGWKAREEQKAAALIAGSKATARALEGILAAAHGEVGDTDGLGGDDLLDPAVNAALAQAIDAARQAFVPEGSIHRVLRLARQGVRDIDLATFEADWDSEAWRTVAGRNTIVALNADHAFMERAEAGGDWRLTRRTDGSVAGIMDAADVLDRVAAAVWTVNDPALHFAGTVAEWNTCAADGPIQTATPAGDVMFLNDTAAVGGIVGLRRFLKPPPAKGQTEADPVDAAGLTHTVRLATLALDISVTMGSAPTEALAAGIWRYRPLALGVADLAGLLAAAGVAYDSEAGRAAAAALTSCVTGTAYATGARLAQEAGAFPGFQANGDGMLRVLRNHRRVAQGQIAGFEGLTVCPAPLHIDDCPLPDVTALALEAWDEALETGGRCGFRNAQASVVGPAGQVGTLLDAASSGIDPSFAQVRFRRTDDGTFEKEIDPVIPRGLRALGYSKAAVTRIVRHAVGHATLDGAPGIDHARLREKGFDDAALARLEGALADAYDIKFAFNIWTLGRDFCEERLGIDATDLDDYAFDMLAWLGFTADDIAAANRWCCGSMTVADAPDLKARHARVFDSGIPQGRDGGATVSAEARVRMAAAVQGLVSGGVATAPVLPHRAGIADCRSLMLLGWHLGLKHLALHREGARLSEPVLESLLEDRQTVAATGKAHDLIDLMLAPAPKRAAALAESLMGTVLPPGGGEVGDAPVSAFLDGLPRGSQEKLPNRRKGYTQKAQIDGQKVYLRTGEYDDGRVGEIFVDVPKESAALRSLVSNFAIAISIGLQHGVPLEEFVETFTDTRFAPAGPVAGNDAIAQASSILDYIFRELAISYLGRDDLASVAADDLAIGGGPQAIASAGYVRGQLTLVDGGR